MLTARSTRAQATAATTSYQTPRRCPQGGFVSFHWPGGTHDVVRMQSRAHYDACDFTGSVTLAPPGAAGIVPPEFEGICGHRGRGKEVHVDEPLAKLQRC